MMQKETEDKLLDKAAKLLDKLDPKILDQDLSLAVSVANLVISTKLVRLLEAANAARPDVVNPNTTPPDAPTPKVSPEQGAKLGTRRRK